MATSRPAKRATDSGRVEIDALITQYLGSRDNQRLTRSEGERCRELLHLWRDAMIAEGCRYVGDLDKRHLLAWSESLIGGRVDPVVARTSAEVRLLFSYASQRRLLRGTGNPAAYLPAVRIDAEALLDEAQLSRQRLLDGVVADTFEAIRDRAFFGVMDASAIWLGGMITLELFDEGTPAPYLILPEGVVRYRANSGQTAIAQVDRKTMEWVDRWLEVRSTFTDTASGGGLWISRRGDRVHRSSMAPRLRKLAKLWGVE